MQSWFTFELDGEDCRVEREDTHRSLASFLAELDPRFARFSARDSWEGDHLVVLGDIEGDRHRFRVIDAARTLLPVLAGRQVWTPEGIRHAEPEHPVNLALREGSFECGRARRDAVVTLMFEGYYRPDLRRQGQINDQFDAVISRTANVPAIRETATRVFASTEQLRQEAAQRAERAGDESTVWTGRKDIFGDRFTRRLFQLKGRPSLAYVDAANRRFYRPDSLVELLRLKREYPEARFVAGGTELARRDASAAWPHLISLEAVDELGSFTSTEEAWQIGGAVSLTRIAERIGRECPAFNKLLRRLGSRALRNRATLGGRLATARRSDPLPPLLMALNARVLLHSEEGERDAPIATYFEETGGTILQPGEVIQSILIPRTTDSVLGARGITSRLCDVYGVGPRRTLCEPYGTGAFAVELRDRHVAKAWIAYSGVGDVPVRAREAEDVLTGKAWEEETLREVLPVLSETVPLRETGEGPVDRDYRRQLVGTLFQKFFFQHPRPDSVRPEPLTATGDFAKLDEPFLDAIAG